MPTFVSDVLVILTALDFCYVYAVKTDDGIQRFYALISLIAFAAASYLSTNLGKKPQ